MAEKAASEAPKAASEGRAILLFGNAYRDEHGHWKLGKAPTKAEDPTGTVNERSLKLPTKADNPTGSDNERSLESNEG